MQKFSFLIPCYNCEKFILNNGFRLLKKIKKNNINFEVFFLNDGSKDSSLQELRKLQFKYKKVKIINFQKNEGKSAVLKKSLKKIKGNIIVFYDCDLPYFNYFNSIIRLLKNGHDFVTIDRRAINSKFYYANSNLYQIFRYIVSKFVNILISFTILSNFKGDTQSGLKGFRVIKNLKSQKFISNKFFLDAEIISFFDQKNLKITSVPIKYKISKTSSIRILALNNILYFYELFKIIITRLVKFR